MTSLRSKIIPSLWGRNGIGVPLALTETLVSQKSFLHSTFYYFTMTMTCKKRNVYPNRSEWVPVPVKRSINSVSSCSQINSQSRTYGIRFPMTQTFLQKR